MRIRPIALGCPILILGRSVTLGCALTGALGLLALLAVPAAASGLATAAKVKPPISVSSPVTDNPYGAEVTITVTLGPTFSDRRVSLYAAPAGEARRLVATGEVNAEGKWYRPTRSPGPPRSPPSSTATRATTELGKPHPHRLRTGDGPGGRLLQDERERRPRLLRFHGADVLALHSTVAPGKPGECLEPETQQYDPGAGWTPTPATAATSWTARATTRRRTHRPGRSVPGTGSGGDYVRGKDTANLSAAGPWRYFIVTR